MSRQACLTCSFFRGNKLATAQFCSNWPFPDNRSSCSLLHMSSAKGLFFSFKSVIYWLYNCLEMGHFSQVFSLNCILESQFLIFSNSNDKLRRQNNLNAQGDLYQSTSNFGVMSNSDSFFHVTCSLIDVVNSLKLLEADLLQLCSS